ncbi:hypothetical protein J2Z62_000529 [Mycoplasmoides fastidiosum]|uniref:Uncharacterized protein n=1 Tax=Mycoplasmoides fastidiosum TaxID=92758 RepID=A0ABU0LZF7_9BACT|nr:hypothetical protein [Mycoplasmoides fastidiosum]MDQ0514091.1 hypothetical protein [Mycoplasmoides fastidiosum]UUD37500.1 hypothetical protein NPA10_02935 [Mycoplasmoides fastidiosum]
MRKAIKGIWKASSLIIAGLTIFIGLNSLNRHQAHTNFNQNFLTTRIQHQDVVFLSGSYAINNLDSKIAEILANIHNVFKSKYQELSTKFEKSSDDETNKSITFLLMNITAVDTNNLWYKKLADNLKKVLYLNVLGDKFHYQNDQRADAESFPAFNYLNEQRKKIVLKLNDPNSHPDFIINTLMPSEARNLADQLLTGWQTYLTSGTDTTFGKSWYEQIPKQLKPVRHYDVALDTQDYQNLIDALTTTKASSEILLKHAKLEEIQKQVEQKLQTELTKDIKSLEDIKNQDKNSQLFLDTAPNNLALNLGLLSNNPHSSQDVDLFKDKWNAHLSKENNISFNPLFSFPSTSDESKAKISDLKLQYFTNGNLNDNPSLDWILSLNNASVQGQYHFPYTATPSETASFLLEKLFVLIQNFGIQNLIDLTDEAKASNKTTFEPADFKQTFDMSQLPTGLLNLLKMEFKITAVQNEFTNKTNINDLLITITGSIQSNGTNPSGSNIIGSVSHDFIFRVNPDLENKLLTTAPKLDPVWNNSIKLESNEQIQQLIAAGQYNRYFSYNNTNSNFQYSTTGIEIGNGVVNVTTEISLNNKYASGMKISYITALPISLFIDNTNFEALATAAADQINYDLTSIYGQLFEEVFNPFELDDLTKQLIFEIKTDSEFPYRSIEENMDLFIERYQKELIDRISSANFIDNDKRIEGLKDHYNEIRERLKAALVKVGISLDSNFAKSLLDQIDITEQNAIENTNVELDPRFLEIIDFIEDSDNNLDTIKSLGRLLEKFSPQQLVTALNQTQKGVAYGFTGITSLILLSSLGLIIRGIKIDHKKYSISKYWIVGIGTILLLMSISGLGYLISLITV